MVRLPSLSRTALHCVAAIAVIGVACNRPAASDKAPADTVSAAVNAGSDTEKALMDSGTALLYTKKDPNAAASAFAELIKRNPGHYGAHYQLAVALDSAGRVADAKSAWEAFLPMAQQAKDTKSEATAQQRLSVPPGGLTDTQLMNNGLYLLYTKNDPGAANARFRELLNRNPAHYGATYQLAAALDREGKPAEARPLWQKVLKMAQETKDQATINTAAARLLRNP
ncbi:MAG: tetratricopeptide repeat protein [Gemmatimonadota bacterium]|nr:tetratricopeptide repeat protein [Gemmatimonadota bacterium]